MQALRLTGVGMAFLLLMAGTALYAQTFYIPVAEWNGTHFHVINGSDVYDQQAVDVPVVDVPFSNAAGVELWIPSSGRPLAFVVDSFHDRIQLFRTDLSRRRDTLSTADFVGTGSGTAVAGQFDVTHINVNAAANLVPGSEKIWINGTLYGRVADVSGFAAGDQVYEATYVRADADGDASTVGVFQTPGNLTENDEIVVEWAEAYTGTFNQNDVVSNNIDYAKNSSGGTVNGLADDAVIEINEQLPNNQEDRSFENLTSLAVAENTTADIADLYLLDAGEIGNVDPRFMTFKVADDGSVFEQVATYDGVLNTPLDITVAEESSANVIATFDPANAWDTPLTAPATAESVLNNTFINPLILNHTFTINVLDAVAATGNTDWDNVRFEVRDETINQTIAFYNTGDLSGGGADPGPFTFDIEAIPGVLIRLTLTPNNDIVPQDDQYTFRFNTTTPARIREYVFITDTNADRIKVIAGGDNGENATNGSAGNWLAGEEIREYYDVLTADEIHPNMTYVTTSRPMEQPVESNTLKLYTANSDGSDSVLWMRVDNFGGSQPDDYHYMYNENTRVVIFGDGSFGRLPEAGDSVYAIYRRGPDVLSYGMTGAGEGRFNNPAGIAARWNPDHQWYDVYVADTGNNRIAKLKFIPSDTLNYASMVWVDAWTTAYSGSNFDSPTDIQVLENNAGEVFLFICDTGNDRVIAWHDSDAETGGNSTATPSFVTAFGGEGAAFGAFMNPTGVSAVPNGADFDVYVSDRDRSVVVKYQLGEAPGVDVDWTVISDYGYLPTGSFTFTKESANDYMSVGAQEGATIRFFFSDTTSAGQDAPSPCSNESFPYSTTSWTWTFSETPGGTPSDGVYYLYVRLYDSNGVFLDEDRSPEGSLFRIDSNLETGLGAYDGFDGDRYLYLQNYSERVIDLDVIYPDSVVAVALSGTFPASMMQIVSIEAGPAWETIQHQNLIFSWDMDADAGTWEVQASVTGSNTGLVSGQPKFTIARATILVNDDAITTDSRVQNSTFALTSGTWVDYKGEVLPDPGLNDLYLRVAYLGDIATSVADAGSPPHMIPVPDGNMDIEDITVFTMGWNGIGGVQDPICDFAPYQGTIPNLWPTPDGTIDTEELLGFTLMLGWFQANLSPSAAFVPGNPATPSGAKEEGRGTLDLDAEHLAMIIRNEGGQRIVEVYANDVEQLMSAQLTVHYDPSLFSAEDYSDGGFLTNNGTFFAGFEQPGIVNLFLARFDRLEPGVDGSGKLAEVVFTPFEDETPDGFYVTFDLRNVQGGVIESGEETLAVADYGTENLPADFAVGEGYPNPFNPSIAFDIAVPRTGAVTFNLFNILGRQVLSETMEYTPGHHTFIFNASSHGSALAGGIYFMRIGYRNKISVRKIVLLK